MSASNPSTGRDPRLRLAAAVLLHHGEISLAEIEALPFVDTREVAEMLAIELARALGAERIQRRATGAGMSRWEDVMCLTRRERPVGSPNRALHPTAGHAGRG